MSGYFLLLYEVITVRETVLSGSGVKTVSIGTSSNQTLSWYNSIQFNLIYFTLVAKWPNYRKYYNL